MSHQSDPPDSRTIETLVQQRLVIVACRRFLLQLREKGLGLTFAERTACNLLLDSIERLGYK